MKKYINLILLLVTTLSCHAQEDLKEYYYPFSNKTETKVYKYIDKNDVTNIEYWKVTSIPETKELKTVSYNSDFNIYNTFDEIITLKGAELIAYTDFEMNEKGEREEIKAHVIDKDVYKWDGNKEFSYSVKYSNKYGRFELAKKRTELGIEKITVSGKEYEAVKFKGAYFINAIDQEDSYGFFQYSYYAKEIGMIKYRRYIPNKIIEMELVEMLSEQEFEKLKASR